LSFDPQKIQKIFPDAQILVKVHYLNKLKIKNKKNIIDVSDFPQINELLKISDVLIADYSSLIFDYCLLKKDIILYHYDYEEYKKERGFYFELADYFPKNIAKSENELINKLKNIENFRQVDFNKFINKFLPNEKGNSSQKIYNDLITDSQPYDIEEVIFLVNQLNEIGGVHNFIKT